MKPWIPLIFLFVVAHGKHLQTTETWDAEEPFTLTPNTSTTLDQLADDPAKVILSNRPEPSTPTPDLEFLLKKFIEDQLFHDIYQQKQNEINDKVPKTFMTPPSPFITDGTSQTDEDQLIRTTAAPSPEARKQFILKGEEDASPEEKSGQEAIYAKQFKNYFQESASRQPTADTTLNQETDSNPPNESTGDVTNGMDQVIFPSDDQENKETLKNAAVPTVETPTVDEGSGDVSTTPPSQNTFDQDEHLNFFRRQETEREIDIPSPQPQVYLPRENVWKFYPRHTMAYPFREPTPFSQDFENQIPMPNLRYNFPQYRQSFVNGYPQQPFLSYFPQVISRSPQMTQDSVYTTANTYPSFSREMRFRPVYINENPYSFYKPYYENTQWVPFPLIPSSRYYTYAY